MMKTRAIGLVVAAMMVSINLAMAANYTVGGATGGWDQATDVATWAASERFVVGDFLIFLYTLNHDVTELSEADFGSCSLSNPLQPSLTGGNTVISLTSAGSRYFTCSTGGHCLSGMKLQIDTVAASTTPSVPSPPPAVPSPPPATTPTVPSPPPSTTPAVPSPPPKPSASPPTKSATPPKTSPPSKTGPSTPAPPPSSTPPTGSALPPPSPSSAAKSGVMGALITFSGFALMMLLNF